MAMAMAMAMAMENGKQSPMSILLPKKWRGCCIGTNNNNNTWLVVSEKDKSSKMEEIGRNVLMKRTGISSHHDLRVFELDLPSSSAIFRRQGAIVFNLDEIKVLITANEILIPDPHNPILRRFIHYLHTLFCCTDDKAAEESLYNALPEAIRGGRATTDLKLLLPFEFISLVICLQSVCEILDYEISVFENEEYTDSVNLVSAKIKNIGISDLEVVRCAKLKLVAFSWRALKVRDELEHLLDDDMGMIDLYLTDKLATLVPKDELDIDADEYELVVYSDDDEVNSINCPAVISAQKPNIEELEMILGAYFIQIEEILSKVFCMQENCDMAELYMKDFLNDKRSQLQQKGGFVTTIITLGIVIMGIIIQVALLLHSGVKLL